MAIVLYELVGADRARPFSPHCWKIVMALAHKGLAFERAPASFTEIPAIEGGSAKTVPLLRDGDRLVSDSMEIALHLDRTYPDRPSLFAGPGGEASARFIERWTQLTVHGFLGAALLMDIHDGLAPGDQAYFRQTREARFGRKLEQMPAGRDAGLAAFRASLEPLRSTLSYQPYLGGEGPLFTDYIVFGAFQWARVASPFPVIEAGDPVFDWFERCLALHDGVASQVPAAA